jgi:CBS domain-containing protein
MSYQSNKEALKMMEEQQISELAVVDKDKRFKGFTNRQIITSRIINLMTKPE